MLIATLKISPLFLFNILFYLNSCSINTANKDIKLNSLYRDTTKNFISSTKILRTNYIPDSIFNKTEITVLWIGGIDCDLGITRDDSKDSIGCWMIKEIQGKIKNLKMLEELSLPLNAISKIPEEISQLKKLKKIDFTDNSGISNIDILVKLENLE